MAKRPKCDIQLSEWDTVGQTASMHLATKGFCTIDAGLSPETMDAASKELQSLCERPRFAPVHPIIAESLLGVDASARIAHYQDDESEGLASLDYLISQIASDLSPCCYGSLGFELAGRTNTIMHYFLEDSDDEARLLDEDVDFWLPQFARHKIMVSLFLAKGSIELSPYENEEAANFEVEVSPGTILLCRPDLMSHTYIGPQHAFALSSFLVMRKTGSMEGETMAPVARQLDQWVVNRLDMLKESQTETSVWDPAIPRDWQRIMNRLSHKGQKVAVRGIANFSAGSQDANAWHGVQIAGADTVSEVPVLRWDHKPFYSEDVDCWKTWKTSVKHGGFMDGIDLFDAKFFSISTAESKGMDPNQRLILECAAQAYFDAGYTKKTLMNSTTGIYVGFGFPQWQITPKEAAAAATASCGVAASIHANRFSFCMGMKGPSMTIDAHIAASMVALHLAAEGVQKKGSSLIPPASAAVGTSILLTPLLWAQHQATGFLSTEGRCMTFDDSATGYVHADGLTSLIVSPLAELVDDDISIVDEDGVYGCIAGSSVSNCGKGASMSSPNAVAVQDVVAQTLRNAHLNGIDVDFIEANSNGQVLDDTIEWSALWRSHRSMLDETPLVISSGKTLPGHCQENAALQCFLRAIMAARGSHIDQQIHLRRVNPYIDTSDTTGTFSTECAALERRSAFFGTYAQGYGGTNGYVCGFASNLSNLPSDKPKLAFDKQVVYWPGGGGSIDEKKLPDRGYHIIGSFNAWKSASAMQTESEGVYSYVITMSDNCFEHFEIWLDGKKDQVLHPGWASAGQESPVMGPDPDNQGAKWMIDGRDEVYNKWIPADHSLQQVTARHENSGKAGDQYKVILTTKGKWRAVSWHKLASSVPKDAVPKGTYYVMGSWNRWDFEAMTPEAEGVHVLMVNISRSSRSPSRFKPSGSFQIVRDKDMDQVFFPYEALTEDAATEIIGPSDADPSYVWSIVHPGQYRITFTRKVDENAVDDKYIAIEKV